MYASHSFSEIDNKSNRFLQLTHWLSRLLAHVQQQPLPSWPSIHSQFAMIIKQLNFLTLTLETHADTLRATNAYPLPSFPVIKQPGLLPTLLRKRNEAEVDEWIAKGKENGAERKETRADDEVWQDAHTLLVALQQRHAWEGTLTAEEVAAGEGIGETDGAVGNGIGRTSNADTGADTAECSLEQILRYVYQGINVHEPVRKLTAGVRAPVAKRM